jgi:uncharacterized membrane protein YGL010W
LQFEALFASLGTRYSTKAHKMNPESTKHVALKKWLNKYAETHTNPTNKMFHYLCVPLIFFTVLALLNGLAVYSFGGGFRLTAAHLLIAFALVFYSRLSTLYTFVMAFVSLAIVFLSNSLMLSLGSTYLWICALVFVLAWIGQFIGHKIEGAKPAFFDDLAFLLIGPLWILDHKLGRKL